MFGVVLKRGFTVHVSQFAIIMQLNVFCKYFSLTSVFYSMFRGKWTSSVHKYGGEICCRQDHIRVWLQHGQQ